LRVIKVKVLRGKFGCKGEEVTGGCRTLLKDKIYNFLSSPAGIE
jgi:hypothetical protein